MKMNLNAKTGKIECIGDPETSLIESLLIVYPQWTAQINELKRKGASADEISLEISNQVGRALKNSDSKFYKDLDVIGESP